MEKTETAKVSVVIPAYNMAAYLPEAIESVLGGRFPPVEVIVVNDGSSDATDTVMEPFTAARGSSYDPRVRYFRKPNGGKSSAVNLALREVRGAFVSILDADDQIPPNGLADLYRVASKTGCDLVIGSTEVTCEQGIRVGVRAAPATDSPAHLRRRFWAGYKTPFLTNACLFSRTLARRTGEFDVRLQRCQDIDYSMRLLSNARSIASTDAVVYRYRKHRSSVKERLRYRLSTMRHRPLVFWKNCHGSSRVPAVLMGLALDASKAVYEVAANYRR